MKQEFDGKIGRVRDASKKKGPRSDEVKSRGLDNPTRRWEGQQCHKNESGAKIH